MHVLKLWYERTKTELRALVYPNRCIGCGVQTDGAPSVPFCAACMTQVRQARAYRCPECEKPLMQCRCVRLGAAELPLYSLFPYHPRTENDAVSRLLLSRKTRLQPAVEDFLAGQLSALCACAAAECGGEADDWILTYPPRSRKKRREVGHDQSEELAKRISRLTGIPMTVCLERVRGADIAQKTLGARERSENAQDSYGLSAHFADDIRGKRVMLIDDIATTGATLSACAAILSEAGADSVIAVTLARTVHEQI